MATTSGPLSGTIDGTNTVFSLGVPYSSVLIVYADSVVVYPGSGPGYFQSTNPATGVITLGSAPVDAGFAPFAIYNDATPVTPPGPTPSISGGGVIEGNIYYPIGTTATYLLGFGVTNSDGTFTPDDLTGATVYFGIKTLPQESSPSVLAKSSPSTGITIPAPASGVAALTISPADMIGDYAGAYSFGAVAVLQSGVVVPGASGRFYLVGSSVVVP